MINKNEASSQTMNLHTTKIAIIGLGYVGLPLAVEFGKQFDTLGFDINTQRVAQLRSGQDRTLETTPEELALAARLQFSTDASALAGCNVFIVTVPTPIDKANRPDLTPLVKASETVGKALKSGDIVIYESTVYPGATEEVCVPILEQFSGLKFNQDFFCGYSPERINPGDKEHRLPSIKKVTSGSTPEIAETVDQLYKSIITAGTFKASSIKVAEAAKVIENTQRDVNIALMNELSLIFHKLGIDTLEVLQAAGTKWNFLPFRPGLVGGHCIGVDPYYLTHKAQEVGYHSEVILAGLAHQRQHGQPCGRPGHQTHAAQKPARAGWQILYGFHQLKELGVVDIPDEAVSMQSNAVSFIDAEAIRRFETLKRLNKAWKNIKTISVTDLEYLYVRTAYADHPMDEATKKLTDFYRSVIENNWTAYDLYERSLIATLMQRAGKTQVVQQILQSYREHAVISAEMGMYWPNNHQCIPLS